MHDTAFTRLLARTCTMPCCSFLAETLNRHYLVLTCFNNGWYLPVHAEADPKVSRLAQLLRRLCSASHSLKSQHSPAVQRLATQLPLQPIELTVEPFCLDP